jgi:endonuclease/exonuclease/phosphatase family metal-dependent hydrolase
MLTLPFIARTFSFSFKPSQEKQPTGSIKIMTYNVRNFDLYNWSHNKETRQKMFDLLAKVKPDILCIQEFYNDTSANKNIHDLMILLGMPYYHYGKTVVLQDHKLPRSWGVITFSKFPIIEKQRLELENTNTNACIYSDILIGTDTVRLYNMHLQSIHFGYNDYEYISKVEDTQDADMIATKNILRKIKKAAIKRGKQVDIVENNIRQAVGKKLIICGDFNDPPVSYTYQQLSKNMQDAFVKKGWGLGRTYSKILPSLRIDYTLLDPSFQVISNKTIHEELSDHYPVVTEFSIR